MQYYENNIVKIPISSDQHHTDCTPSVNIIPQNEQNAACISLEESKGESLKRLNRSIRNINKRHSMKIKILEKMIADNRAVQSYIRKHGNLNGFYDETIEFAKPLQNFHHK